MSQIRPVRSSYLDVTTLLPWTGRFYVFRVALVAMTLAMMAVDGWLCSVFSPIHYLLIGLGLTYPHFFQWLLGRFDNRQRRGRVSLVFDGLFAGMIISALDFAAVPAVVLAVINLFNWMALGGPGLTMLGLVALGLGVGIAGQFTDFGVGWAACAPVATVSYLMLLGYIILVAAVVYRYSSALRGYCYELLADKDVAVRERIRADQALLAVLPQSVALELARSHTVAERRVADATIVRVEIRFPGLGGESSIGLADVGEVAAICDHIFARHGFEAIKTFGRHYLAYTATPMGPDEAIAACREIDAFLQCQAGLGRGGVSHAAAIRAVIHHGAATLGMVQQDRLNFDAVGPVVDEIAAVPPDVLGAHRIVVSRELRARVTRNWTWQMVAVTEGMQWYALAEPTA